MNRHRGLTFIEVLIAVVIAGIVLSAMLTSMNFTARIVRHNANKTMALNFAQELMEELKDKDYEDEYAINPYYHTGDYTNYLGPEFNNVEPNEQDDDTDEDNFVERAEFDDADDYNGYEDTVQLYQSEGAGILADRIVGINGIHLDEDTGTESDVDSDENGIVDSNEYTNITYKAVTVSVSWDWWNKSYVEEVNTIISDHN